MLRKFLLLAIRSSVAYRLSQPVSNGGSPSTLAGQASAPMPVHA